MEHGIGGDDQASREAGLHGNKDPACRAEALEAIALLRVLVGPGRDNCMLAADYQPSGERPW
jgi:hypothetical protein